MAIDNESEAPLANVNTTDIHPVVQEGHIETGISDHVEPGSEDAKSPVSAREIAMRKIAEKYEAKIRKEELALGEAMADEATERAHEEAPPAPAPEPDPAPPAPEPVAPAPQAAAQPESQKRVIKVNGQELALTDDEMVRLAQLGMASGQTFREAARLRQEAEALRQAPVAPAATVPAAAAPQASPTHGNVDDATARELARRLSYGTEEDQTRAIRDLIETARATGRAEGPTPEQIAQAVEQRVLARTTFEANLKAIGTEFPDVFADEDLTLLAAKKVGTLRQKAFALAQAAYAQGQQPTMPTDLDLYREACKEVSAKFANSAPPPTAPRNSVQAAPAVAPSDRLERKRAAPKPPIAANRTAALPEAPRPPTGSEIVNRMRQARQQPVLS